MLPFLGNVKLVSSNLNVTQLANSEPRLAADRRWGRVTFDSYYVTMYVEYPVPHRQSPAVESKAHTSCVFEQ
jgi:hypothetical protein